MYGGLASFGESRKGDNDAFVAIFPHIVGYAVLFVAEYDGYGFGSAHSRRFRERFFCTQVGAYPQHAVPYRFHKTCDGICGIDRNEFHTALCDAVTACRNCRLRFVRRYDDVFHTEKSRASHDCTEIVRVADAVEYEYVFTVRNPFVRNVGIERCDFRHKNHCDDALMMYGTGKLFQIGRFHQIIYASVFCKLFAKPSEKRRRLFCKIQSADIFPIIFFELFYGGKSAHGEFVVLFVSHGFIVADCAARDNADGGFVCTGGFQKIPRRAHVRDKAALA